MLDAESLLRFRRLGASRWRLLVRAATLLTASSAALSVLPFRVAIRLGCVPLRPGSIRVEECVWAVEAAARRLPWRIVCIGKALVVQRMLRSGGVDARLHFGAKTMAAGDPEAHVWVSVAGHAVIGGEEAKGFAELANYP